MSTGDTVIFKGSWSLGTPLVDDVVYWQTTGGNPTDPYFKITEIEDLGEIETIFKATQLSDGTLPATSDFVFSDYTDVGGYGGANEEWYVELSQDAVTRKQQWQLYRGTPAYNEIWYDDATAPTDVPIDIEIISWALTQTDSSPLYTSVTNKTYFGTDNPPPLVQETDSEGEPGYASDTYTLPSSLSNSTTYYLRGWISEYGYTDIISFTTEEGDPVPPVDKTYSRALIAIANNEVWYESSAGTMAELASANGTIDCSKPLEAVEAYQKIFITNKTNIKVLDFSNTKINTADAGANPCTFGMTLTGGTSGAKMIVDYVDGVTDDAAANIYGFRTTTATFSSGETVTGTNSAGSAVSFVTSAAETDHPHVYSWTVFGKNATNYGTMLSYPTLVCLYRGRLVISGDYTLPQAWQMSKVGNPWKFLYDYTNDGELSAVAYSNNKVGLIGDIIVSLTAYKDDLLIFGCANSIWGLVGDPLSSGQLTQITNNTGIWGSRAWCLDGENNFYFLGNDGIYRMGLGATFSAPENISKERLPNLILDWDLDKSLHRVSLSYDPVNKGIIVSKTLISDGTNSNYWLDLTTGGYFSESYPTSCGIFSSYYYPATDETYKKFLVGCTDGYIREFDISTKNDTTTSSTSAIDSYFTIIQKLGEDEESNSLMRGLVGVLAGGASGGSFSDSDGVTCSIYKGDDAETVLEDIKDGATAFTSYTWSSTGKSLKAMPRMRCIYAGLNLRNSTASQTWALEKVYADVIKKGKR